MVNAKAFSRTYLLISQISVLEERSFHQLRIMESAICRSYWSRMSPTMATESKIMAGKQMNFIPSLVT